MPDAASRRGWAVRTFIDDDSMNTSDPSITDWLASLGTLGALAAAVFAALWAKRSADYSRRQAEAAHRQLEESRNANALPILVELFREHRSERLAEARRFIWHELRGRATPNGLSDLSDDESGMVRDLAWFYDNLGALVAHGIVDIDAIAGYMGGSVVETWDVVGPKIVVPERQKRAAHVSDPSRWQEYFENLRVLVIERGELQARKDAPLWRL